MTKPRTGPVPERFFGRLYQRVISWASHRLAVVYLALLAFAESSFFPIPPDVMLIPMSVARPTRALQFAGISTLASVLGGVVGYFIGSLAMVHVQSAIEWLGYDAAYDQVTLWFHTYGFWIVFVAGFSPIPYKLFTTSAGALGLALLPFVIASVIGRGARFYLIALVLAYAGPRLLPHVERYIELVGWLMVTVIIAGSGWLMLTH